MKHFNTLLILILVFSLYNCSNKDSADKKPEIVREKLLSTIHKFNKAFKDGDVEILESMITENYLHTNGNSKSIRKEDWIGYLQKRKKEIESENLEVVDYKMDEMEIELFGNTAIVTGRVLVLSRRANGLKKNEYRITNVWVNESGNWKRAGFHDGKIQ